MGLWDREKKAFGNDVQTKENPMSRNNSLKLRAALTLGATALALCVTTGPSLAAGGHEGHAAGIAATRGGDREGMRGGMNERMNSLRVETLSPAGFVSHGPFISSHVFPPPKLPVSTSRPQPVSTSQPAQPEAAMPQNPQPVSGGHGVIQDPLQRAQPMATGGHGVIQDPLQRAQPMATGGHGVIQDP